VDVQKRQIKKSITDLVLVLGTFLELATVKTNDANFLRGDFIEFSPIIDSIIFIKCQIMNI
jgi:hypothetical protein